MRDATPGDANALADVFIGAWRHEHAGLLPQDVLDARSASQSAANWSRTLVAISAGELENRFVLAVVRGGLIVGLLVGDQVASRRPSGEGEVVLIQVADGHRGSGVGKVLMAAGAQRLIAMGARAMIVRVLEANLPARGFYESLGGDLTTETRNVEESGRWFPECVYRWPDLAIWS